MLVYEKLIFQGLYRSVWHCHSAKYDFKTPFKTDTWNQSIENYLLYESPLLPMKPLIFYKKFKRMETNE